MERCVILVSSEGKTLAERDTDRTEFPTVATWSRDRIFLLSFQGRFRDLRADWPNDAEGAIYVEYEPWRISMKSLDEPRPARRRRKSAVILPFRGRAA